MNEFKLAWNALIDWELPAEPGSHEEAGILMFMPVVGLIVGVAVWLLAGLSRLLIAKPLLAGFIAALAIVILYAGKIRGPRLASLAELGVSLETRQAQTEQQNRLSGGLRIPQVICLGWLLAVLVAITSLVAEAGTGWLIVIPVLSMTALAELSNRLAESPAPGYAHWLVAIVIMLVTGILIGRLAVASLALLLAWMIGSGTIRLSAIRHPESRIWAMIALLELGLLWIGALAL